MRIPRLLTVSAACLLLLAACGDDSSTSNKATTGSSTTTAAGAGETSAPPPTEAKASGSASTPVSVAPTHPLAHLVAVRAARQETVDRVVFEFSEQVPGYKVAYMPKPIVGTSGKEVATSGSAALVVRLEQASGFNLDTGKPTYTGPPRVQPAGTRAVTEVAQVEDFEGVLSWVIGVQAQVAFRVSALAAPPRLVIDIPS